MSVNIQLSSKQIFKNILFNKLYASLLILSIIFTISASSISNKIIVPLFYDEVIFNILDEAKRVGNHVTTHSIDDIHTKNFFQKVKNIKNDFQMEKIQVFTKKGRVVYSTDKKDIGNINTHDYFRTIIAQGHLKYKVVKKGGTSSENVVFEKDVAEIYVPIIREGKFEGAIEVYYDITSKIQRLLTLSSKISLITGIISIMLLLLILLALYQASKKDLLEKEKDKLLFQKSNLTSLGEMIANIAHQWRQPLSVITIISSTMQLKQELNLLSKEEIFESSQKITENANALSQTIETFRNFLNKDKKHEKVILQETIDDTLNIVLSTLNSNHIKLIKNINYDKPLELKTISSELSEVIINLINNARDVLLERKVLDPWITITLVENQGKAILSIEDNGGGISLEMQTKVFEPYFTTKHQSFGTGLGLHISHNIISESLKGHIYTKNSDNGAVFYIELELN